MKELSDGILQRRYVYSLTAQTGHGKTAMALLIARLVGGSAPDATLGPHSAECPSENKLNPVNQL